MTTDQLLTIQDVVRLTKLSTRTVNHYLLEVDRQKLPSLRIGKRRLIRERDLDRWLEQFRSDKLDADATRTARALLRKLG